jgi:hypothetical protein
MNVKCLKSFNHTEQALAINNTVSRVRIPNDFDEFMFDYKRSRFLECNQTSAQITRNRLGTNVTEHDERSKRIGESLKYITSIFDSMKKTYWLASGSLLGGFFFKKILFTGFNL